MKYAGMPFGMWALFSGSFQKQLIAVLCYDAHCKSHHEKGKAAIPADHPQAAGV